MSRVFSSLLYVLTFGSFEAALDFQQQRQQQKQQLQEIPKNGGFGGLHPDFARNDTGQEGAFAHFSKEQQLLPLPQLERLEASGPRDLGRSSSSSRSRSAYAQGSYYRVIKKEGWSKLRFVSRLLSLVLLVPMTLLFYIGYAVSEPHEIWWLLFPMALFLSVTMLTLYDAVVQPQVTPEIVPVTILLGTLVSGVYILWMLEFFHHFHQPMFLQDFNEFSRSS